MVMKKAVFLDSEGVINEINSDRVKYVNTSADVYLLHGAAKALKLLNDLQYMVFIVTNQGGIGLGYMKERTLTKIFMKLLDLLLLEAEAVIDDIAYCPHKPNAGCICRKPKPAMLLGLAAKHHIDLQASFTIGDMATDIAAGKAAKTRTILIVDEQEVMPVMDVDHAAFSLQEAVQWIEQETKSPLPVGV
jgi:D-glycero-D-manno-heptose 1,7-bisphosphate phosphatase